MNETMRAINRILNALEKLDVSDLEYVSGKILVEIQQRRKAPKPGDPDYEKF
jgi:hypothetical protein